MLKNAGGRIQVERRTEFMGGRVSRVKVPVLPKLIDRLNAAPIEMPASFCLDTKWFYNHRETQRNQNRPQNRLWKRRINEGIPSADVTISCTVIVMKPCGIGAGKQRVQKQAHASATNWPLMEVQRQFSGERVGFPTDSIETIGHSFPEKWTATPKWHLVQKLTQNRS